ncbi:ribose-phosphate pyrophosphokinase [Candidatus Woesearchaeota archaeon]|nr:ribose-phosphate pyrophosphokinase [Candidatus Woesearchaeota archaeon]
MNEFLRYKDIIPFELYAPIAEKFDVLVAPDKGAKSNVQKLSDLCKKPLVVIEKFRPKKEQVKILEIKGDVKNKRALIVDDMISTGGTIIEASKVLLQKGAKEVSVIATHGVFSGDAIKNLKKSQIKNVYVTNSIPPNKSEKIKIIDLSEFLKKIINN